MHASVHVADLGLRAFRPWRRAAPRAGRTPGLRWARTYIPAPLGSGPPKPQPGRHTLIAFWDDLDAADRFLEPAEATILASGWHLRLECVRRYGAWPGVPVELPTSATVTHEGPTVVITLGRLRLTQTIRFFRASGRAEDQVRAAPGFSWGTGLASPPHLATLSWWHDAEAMGETVRGVGSHRDAIREQRKKDFHHESAFLRFRVLSAEGSLDGRNPIPQSVRELR